MISCDDANADWVLGDDDDNCKYFHNCMECQGTVEPSGVTTEVSFNFFRDVCSKLWHAFGDNNWVVEMDKSIPWHNDDLRDDDEDTIVSSQDHIYQIDGPGLTIRDTWDGEHWWYTGNFREYVAVEIDGTWYQCSDFYKWHAQYYLKQKLPGRLMRGITNNLLGQGWISIPGIPPYYFPN